MKKISKRLHVAALLAPTLKEPDFYPMSKENHVGALNKWAKRLLEMADTLIESEKESSKDAG